MLRYFLVLVALLVSVSSHAELLGYGEYAGYLISETGRVNRDLNLLLIRREEDFPPFLVGGDLVTFIRYPKRLHKPLYLFNELSAELQNLRLNGLVNFSSSLFAQVNYQVNEKRLLDAFMTLGNLKKSPVYLTIGRQYLSYGDFNKFDVEPNPLTKSLFRIIEPAASIGYYHHGWLLKSIVSDSSRRYGFLAQKTLVLGNAQHRLGAGYLKEIGDSNKALSILSTSKHLDILNVYDLVDFKAWSFRFELSNAIGRIESLSNVRAYDFEGLYRFNFLGKPTKLIASTSGVWPKRLKYNTDFKQLGLFVNQYVLSIKHQVKKHITIGVAFILGINESVHQQGALNLVIKF